MKTLEFFLLLLSNVGESKFFHPPDVLICCFKVLRDVIECVVQYDEYRLNSEPAHILCDFCVLAFSWILVCDPPTNTSSIPPKPEALSQKITSLLRYDPFHDSRLRFQQHLWFAVKEAECYLMQKLDVTIRLPSFRTNHTFH